MLLRVLKLWESYGGLFLSGLGWTLIYAAVTVFFGTLIGAILAVLRLTKLKILRFLIGLYVEIIRGTPLLLQLYFFWLGLEKFTGMELSDATCIVVALIINSSAYVSEIVRAGIQAVDKGQSEAAKSLGMSDSHMMMRIIMPQAIKNILPALGNEFIMMVKETSLASTFYLGELMTVNYTVRSATFLTIEPLIISGTIYFIVTYSLSQLISFSERRMAIHDGSTH